MQPDSRRLPATVRRLAMAAASLGVALALPASAHAAVRIVVDPGHGGHDPGAMSAGLKEKTTNLLISREVVKEARRQGWHVSMTRQTDRFIPLTKRPRRATTFHADVFVSIHSNSTGRRAKGNMTIYRSGQGKRLGQAIMSELAPMTPYGDVGNHKDSRGLAVLRAAKKPAVIVEVLSVTAKQERSQLKDPKMRRKYAQAIVRGIAKYEGVKYKPLPKPKPAEKKPAPVTPDRSDDPTKTPDTKPLPKPVDADLYAHPTQALLPIMPAQPR